jgi:hypothetical protein
MNHDYESLGYVIPAPTPDSAVESIGPRFRTQQGTTPPPTPAAPRPTAHANVAGTCHDYESLGFLDWKLRHPEIIEAFQGTAIVGWYGKIEGQLVNMLNDAEKGRNFTYADKLREFLKIWRANEITGSINRETLEILKGASDILSVDQWNFNAYFRSLRDQLKVLIASEEQLPRGMEEPGNEPMAGGGGGGGAPPMSPTFGAEENAPGDGGEGGAGGMPGGMPGDVPAEPGAEGQPGAEGVPAPGEEPKPGEEEAPGAEPGAPTPEENEEDPPNPDEMPGERLGLA